MLQIISGHCNGERYSECVEVPLTAADLICLGCTQLQEIASAFGLAHEVERLVLVLHDGPIGVVLPDGRVNLKPARQLDEKLDVVALVELLRERALDL